MIGDGQTVNFRIPTGPAPELTVTVEPVGGGDPETVRIDGAGGSPITLSDPITFDPGYLGIEKSFEGGTTTMRVTAPQLTGTPQGQVHFTFKLAVGA